MATELGFELREVVAHRAVTTLNEMLQADPEATRALVCRRVECNRELAEHPTVTVGYVTDDPEDLFLVGLLGVVNGMCGPHWTVVAVYDDKLRQIVRFEAIEGEIS